MPVNIKIPSRENWLSHETLCESDIDIFTDGSKVDNRASAGVYSRQLAINESYRLSDGISTLQAEIAAINKAAELIQSLDLLPTRIAIYADSQTAINALSA